MRPEFAIISERLLDNKRVVQVDTKKAKYQGMPWRTLGDFGKRKFETLLTLETPKVITKVIYV